MDSFIDNDLSEKKNCATGGPCVKPFLVLGKSYTILFRSSEFSTVNNSYNANVHSFSKQCFARSSFDTILGDFPLIFKLSSADIS